MFLYVYKGAPRAAAREKNETPDAGSFFYYPKYMIWLEIAVNIMLAILQAARIFLGASRRTQTTPSANPERRAASKSNKTEMLRPMIWSLLLTPCVATAYTYFVYLQLYVSAARVRDAKKEKEKTPGSRRRKKTQAAHRRHHERDRPHLPRVGAPLPARRDVPLFDRDLHLTRRAARAPRAPRSKLLSPPISRRSRSGRWFPTTPRR